MITMHNIRVCQASADEWCVGIGAGHYAEPLSKGEAIRKALRIAMIEKVGEIGIYNLEAQLLEIREVSTLVPSAQNVQRSR
jgi:hypothetical protein